jgi:pimeloyl-ACP methyl ester carboxylesterase
VISANLEGYAAFTAAPEGVAPAEWSILMNRASEAAARLLWPLGDTRLERRLHRVRCPTLIIWGAEDRVLAPSYAARFATGIAGKTETAIIPGAGHLADLDAPEAAADAVVNWRGMMRETE